MLVKRSRVFWHFLLLLLLASWSSAATESRTVTYSWPVHMQMDKRGDYPVALLQLALSKADQRYQVKPSDIVMSQHRTLKQLELQRGIDVVWTMSTALREQQFRPIRIPIDRGLIGWRLLAISQRDVDLFNNLTDATQLKALLTVQGADWPDLTILQANGFVIAPSNHFDGMYQMLSQGRVRYFPRSLTEIWPELAQRPALPLTVAPRWVLYYPAALYFFVNKSDTQLATALETGLERAIADGSMLQLFRQYFQQAIIAADLPNRQVVPLTNPTLSATMPLHRPELWFDRQKGY
jgi:hypothetical protein